MTTKNENANYDFQSFDNHPTAPMYPEGWDLSEMHPEPKVDSASQPDESAEDESC
ncbi:MAG: hypothetical protein H6634_12340 [Anaerolineales bacterium]|nr:hypothetical protein [Anaerolineales bacterium]